MNFLSFLLMMPVSVVIKTFPLTLAFAANLFTVPFNYVPLTVTDCADHFSLPVSSTYDAIKKPP